MKLWFSKTGEKTGRPWRVRLDDGSEFLCASVKAVGLCSTAKLPPEVVTEGAWCVELPDPPGSVLLDFVATSGPAHAEAQRLAEETTCPRCLALPIGQTCLQCTRAKEAAALPVRARGKARQAGRRGVR